MVLRIMLTNEKPPAQVKCNARSWMRAGPSSCSSKGRKSSPRDSSSEAGGPLAFFSCLSRGEPPRPPRCRLGWKAAGKAQAGLKQSCERERSTMMLTCAAHGQPGAGAAAVSRAPGRDHRRCVDKPWARASPGPRRTKGAATHSGGPGLRAPA